jgi:hypothetical protein
VSTYSEQTEAYHLVDDQPHLIFSTELDGMALYNLLLRDGLIEELAAQQCGIAVAICDFNQARIEAIHQLNAHGIYTVAWLLLPANEGYWFNLQNYPQAIEHYRNFRAWAWEHHLQFQAIGIDIEPPQSEVVHMQRWRLRDLARRLWLAHENVLYRAARSAYTELIAEIQRDGYEAHVYQFPLIADDRRAGTSLIQRALDIVDLPADLEVLMCYSSMPIESLGNDLGGALIASYGPAADSIGVGSTGVHISPGDTVEHDNTVPSLPWEALERDMLLACRYTDTIYVSSLEGCVERGLLPRIATIDWSSEPHDTGRWRVLIETMRTLLLLALLLARFYRVLFAWLGWFVALVLLVQHWRQGRHTRRQAPPDA